MYDCGLRNHELKRKDEEMSLTTRAANVINRSLINVTGEEAEKFLQSVLTTDLSVLGHDDVMAGALLSPQGKIIVDFMISRIDDGFRIEVPSDVVADFAKKLVFFRLRSKAKISEPYESLIQVCWHNDSITSQNDSTKRDRRFPDTVKVWRIYGTAAESSDDSGWSHLRSQYGIAESDTDYALGDVFPHDVNYDQTKGISFTKGCYVGQEVVSRMQHRGTARRRALTATANSALPVAGTALTAEGKELGTLGHVDGHQGLALVRIDRVKDAHDKDSAIMAGDIIVNLSLPEGVTFTFPEKG